MVDTSSTVMSNQTSLREKLATWDAKTSPQAPLTEKQKDTFMELTTLSSSRPLPIELPLDDHLDILPVGLSTLSIDNDPLAKQLDVHGKIENAQQFFSWYADMETQMEAEDEEGHRQFLAEVRNHKQECDQILEEVCQALSHLQQLRDKYVSVSTKTNALHEACEHLLTEQTKLVNTAESINNKLSYFNELERISSKLGSPTLAVTSESFIPMLSRLDECIAYLIKNPQYKEGSIYLAKFKQCLSRATSLIKTHVFNILQTATHQVMPQKPSDLFTIDKIKPDDVYNVNAEDILSVSDDAFTLFYGKFRTNAPRVKALMEQVEARVDKSPEYEQLLVDCHQCYFNQRMTLLTPSVTSAVTELATKHSRDHCALVRSGCAFMVHVCEDEYQLFYHFFSDHTVALQRMLESLCTTLYDVLRPMIIHINHLETLAELCAILKVEMLEEHVQNHPQQLSAFETICSQMLEDVQERLVYRTYIYIRSDILNYQPASGDLAYPEKLEMMENIAASIREKKDHKTHSRASSTTSITSLEVAQITGASLASGDDQPTPEPQPFATVSLAEPLYGGGNMPMSPADLHGMWYPTVRRTLVCLSKLYRCIDRTTFQGLSQETLSMCIYSLISASEQISKRKNSKLDGELFLIKHLLILREQIAPFHVDFSVKEMALDFSKIRHAAYDLLTSRSKILALNSNNALLQFLLEGTPQVMETFVDSKKEVDSQLKKTCEDFISHVSEQFVGPLSDFIDKVEKISNMMKEDGIQNVSVRQQPFATPEKVHDVVAFTYKNLKSRKPEVLRSMALYLANRDTEYILFRPIKARVQQQFQQMLKLLQQNYNEEDQQIVGCPSLEQINLLLSTGPGLTRPQTPQEAAV